jgi:hypothetical protein
MMPAGLKDISFLPVSGHISAPGSSGPGLSKGQQPVSDSPVTPINARLGPGGLLMKMLAELQRQEKQKTRLVRTLQGDALLIGLFPDNWIIESIVAGAKPTIQIVGNDDLPIECELVDIRLATKPTNCIVIRFHPRPAYVLNTETGPGGTWRAVKLVIVHTERGFIELENRKHSPEIELRKVP